MDLRTSPPSPFLSAEIPGANGQGETPDGAKQSLRQAIELILEDRTAEALRGLPKNVIRDKIIVE